MGHYQFQTVPTLIAGLGSIQQLPDVLKNLQSHKILLLTDQGLVQQHIHQPIINLLDQHQYRYQLYQEIHSDPSEAEILTLVDFSKHQAIDTVIGFGGGSVMDAAKVAALLAHPQQTQHLQDIYGINQAQHPRLKLILIPTTAGTGSEVTPISIVTTSATTKTGIVSPILYADVALLDAHFSLNLPASITASTGIDAMVHAIEAYTSKIKKNPYSDLLAKSALRLLNHNLPKVLKNGQDAEARQAMLEGAMLAGQAFANAPVAAIHALAYPLGGRFHIAHGQSNAMVMLEVMKFNAPQAKQYYAELMTWLDPKSSGCIDGLCDLFIDHFYNLLNLSQLDLSLQNYGIHASDLEQLAHDAMQHTRLLQNNPRELTYQDALQIYQTLYDQNKP